MCSRTCFARLLLKASAFLVVNVFVGAEPAAWTLASPNGGVSLTITQPESGARLSYRVELGSGAARRVLLPDAPLGLRRADEDFTDGMVAGEAVRRTVKDAYELPRGKQRKVQAHGAEMVLPLVNRNGHRLEIVARAYDDGVAFRYRFPERSDRLVFMLAEETGFQLPAGARAEAS
ncbi:MAG: glycoside hydrolase family 97 N-terminal domain-containing protein [Opitutaceae bacterium]|nr:glycoside hydrolase family 97 N-terminal domain-containing protein [Opitutaceae bacterium]